MIPEFSPELNQDLDLALRDFFEEMKKRILEDYKGVRVTVTDNDFGVLKLDLNGKLSITDVASVRVSSDHRSISEVEFFADNDNRTYRRRGRLTGEKLTTGVESYTRSSTNSKWVKTN